MPHRFLLLALLLLLPSVAHAEVVAERPDLSAEAMEQLRAGEYLIAGERGDMNHATVVGVVDVPILHVYEMIRDFDAYPEWYPDQVEAELLEQTETTGVASGTVRVPFPFANRTYVMDVVGEEGRHEGRTVVTIQWKYREGSGNLNDSYGFWYLEQWEDDPEGRTLVSYNLWADLGMWLPDAIVRWATRRMLPGILNGIESRWAYLQAQ